MSTQVYVVTKKYNHFSTFQPSIVASPVVTWNAGATHIEGVYSYYPTQYAHNMGYQIYGPYSLHGGFHTEVFQRSRPNPSGPALNYPPAFDFGDC